MYAVEVNEPAAPFFADLLWIDVELPRAESIETAMDVARQYSLGDRVYPQGTTPDSREVLTQQFATVISTVARKN